jgi:hypothetical protein
MKKYTGVEKTELLSAEKHSAINHIMKRFAKSSVQQLSDDERDELNKSLESDEKV